MFHLYRLRLDRGEEQVSVAFSHRIEDLSKTPGIRPGLGGLNGLKLPQAHI